MPIGGEHFFEIYLVAGSGKQSTSGDSLSCVGGKSWPGYHFGSTGYGTHHQYSALASSKYIQRQAFLTKQSWPSNDHQHLLELLLIHLTAEMCNTVTVWSIGILVKVEVLSCSWKQSACVIVAATIISAKKRHLIWECTVRNRLGTSTADWMLHSDCKHLHFVKWFRAHHTPGTSIIHFNLDVVTCSTIPGSNPDWYNRSFQTPLEPTLSLLITS